MNPSNLLLLLTVVAGLLGAVAHSLSDDGAASVLEHFGIEGRLPKGTVYFAVLVSTFGAGTVDSVLGGADWPHALAAAALAFIASVFGAAKQQTAASKVKSVLLVVLLSGGIGACALFTPANVLNTETTAKDVACIIEHAFLDDPTLNVVCNLVTPAQQSLGRSTAAEHRAGVAKATAALKAEHCAPDAGAAARGL